MAHPPARLTSRSRTVRLCSLALTMLCASAAAAEPALWRIRAGATEITLFGTMHELPAGTAWQSPRIAAALDAADTLVLETVVPDDRGIVTALVSRLGYSPGLPRLGDRVAPSKRTTLIRAAAAAGLSMDTLDPMETWLATITLGDAALGRAGLSARDGVEAALTARMHALRRPVIGLETLEQQFGYFDTLPESDQRKLLDATVDDTATAAADAARLVDAWQSGDTARIAAAFAADAFSATPLVRRVLFADRNARWAAWITARLQQPGHIFVAVGAAHLAGPDSVQALLAARGITVERLN